MATLVKSKKGKKIVLLNPAEKGAKFAKELKQGRKRKNDGSFLLDEKGKSVKLSKAERAYRGGYLDARKDAANAYNARKKKRRS